MNSESGQVVMIPVNAIVVVNPRIRNKKRIAKSPRTFSASG